MQRAVPSAALSAPPSLMVPSIDEQVLPKAAVKMSPRGGARSPGSSRRNKICSTTSASITTTPSFGKAARQQQVRCDAESPAQEVGSLTPLVLPSRAVSAPHTMDATRCKLDCSVSSSSSHHPLMVLMMDGHTTLPASADQAVYLSILKELLGQEIRGMIGEEMRGVIRDEMQKSTGAGIASDCSEVAVALPCTEPSVPPSPCDQEKCEARDSFRDLGEQLGVRSYDLEAVEKTEEFLKTKFPCISWVSNKWALLGTVNGPQKDTCLKRLLESFGWNLAVNLAIVVNVGGMIIQMNQEVMGERNGMWLVWDSLFLCLFTLDIFLRLACSSWYYFVNSDWIANWFDLFLVGASAVSLIVSNLDSAGNFMWLRLLRVGRALKTFRMLRLALYFDTLRAILVSIWNSFFTLIWSLLALLVFYLMFSLVVVSRVGEFFAEQGDNVTPDQVASITKYFSSVQGTMVTFILATTGGIDWGDPFHALALAGHDDEVVFMAFVLFFDIALMNIILGVFVQEVMKSFEPDPVDKAHDVVMAERRFSEALFKLCSKGKRHDDSTMTREEWRRAKKDHRLMEVLQYLGLQEHHVNTFFTMLSKRSDCDGAVRITDFVQGCMRLKGTASCFDMHALLFEFGALKEIVLQERAGREKLTHN